MNTLQIILIIIAVLILFIIFLYNRLINLNNRCKNAWSGIDNQLKRRNDLIPNLIEVVKGYAAYEKDTLNQVVEARNKVLTAVSLKDSSIASDQLSDALTHVFMLSEAYPALKANTSFERLQIELVGTEDKIAYARQFYNDCVQYFNTTIMMFPNNIFANMLKYKEREYFKVSDEEKENVSVKL